MTVCIAAACSGGSMIVSATDGLLSTGDITGDSLMGKMFWLGDWQFMYAGTPGNISLISGLIEEAAIESEELMSRRYIQRTVRTAYRRFVAEASSFQSLNAFDMTLEDFKQNGLAFFGDDFHGELARQIKYQAGLLEEQLIVTGWGLSPISAMIYEVGPTGHWLHSAACFGVIGSGSGPAQSMLLSMEQRRESTLTETIFNVACAKFAAEKSTGLDVGRNTSIYVSRKRVKTDEKGRLPGQFIQQDEIAGLRDLWERHVKPKIPDEAWQTVMPISARLCGGKASMRDVGNRVNAEKRLRGARMRACEELSRVAEPNPPSPKAGRSRQRPSRGKRGETGAT